MGLVRRFLVVVALGSIVRMWLVQSQLPSRIATHFDAGGTANGWMSPSGLVAFHVALLALMLIVFLGLPRLVRRLPVAAINVPNRDHWLAPERREATLQRIEDWMAALGLLVVGGIALLEELVVRASLPGGDGRLPLTPLVGVLAALLVGGVVWTIGFMRLWRIAPR